MQKNINNILTNILELDETNVWVLDKSNKFGYSDGIKSEQYLRKVLTKASDISSDSYELETYINDWNSEGNTRHQTAKKLCDWIEVKLKELKTEKEIAFILFHYTKYWNIYFSKSTDYSKRIVVLTQLSNILENRGNELITNINKTLSITIDQLSDLIIDVEMPPFLLTPDQISNSNLKVSPGYEILIKRFNNARIDANEYFRNFKELNYIDLISQYIDSNIGIRKAISGTIFGKLEEGLIPTKSELDFFVDLLKKNENKELLKNDNFFYHFSKRNYLF